MEVSPRQERSVPLSLGRAAAAFVPRMRRGNSFLASLADAALTGEYLRTSAWHRRAAALVYARGLYGAGCARDVFGLPKHIAVVVHIVADEHEEHAQRQRVLVEQTECVGRRRTRG